MQLSVSCTFDIEARLEHLPTSEIVATGERILEGLASEGLLNVAREALAPTFRDLTPHSSEGLAEFLSFFGERLQQTRNGTTISAWLDQMRGANLPADDQILWGVLSRICRAQSVAEMPRIGCLQCEIIADGLLRQIDRSSPNERAAIAQQDGCMLPDTVPNYDQVAHESTSSLRSPNVRFCYDRLLHSNERPAATSIAGLLGAYGEKLPHLLANGTTGDPVSRDVGYHLACAGFNPLRGDHADFMRKCAVMVESDPRFHAQIGDEVRQLHRAIADIRAERLEIRGVEAESLERFFGLRRGENGLAQKLEHLSAYMAVLPPPRRAAS